MGEHGPMGLPVSDVVPPMKHIGNYIACFFVNNNMYFYVKCYLLVYK